MLWFTLYCAWGIDDISLTALLNNFIIISTLHLLLLGQYVSSIYLM